MQTTTRQLTSAKLQLVEASGMLSADLCFGSEESMDAQCQNSILIVEDDASIRMLIVEVLQQGGYQTTAVIDAETAMQEMRAGTFSMVLTDYQLPGLSGDQFICRIAQIWPQTRTLLMSAHPDVAQMAERCKADAMFRKGEPMSQLLASGTQLVPIFTTIE